MALLNQVVCGNVFANTGVGKCTFIPREIKGLFIVPLAFVISQANAVNLQSYLEAQAKAPIKSERIYPVHKFVGLTDNSEDVTSETFGYGGVSIVREGSYNWQLRFVNGGLCLLTALQAYNGQDVAVIFYDGAGNLIGTRRNGGLAGIPLNSFWAHKWTPSDGSTTAGFNLSVSFDAEYINQKLSFISGSTDADLDLSSIVGIMDIGMQVVSATAGDAVLSISERCSGNASDFGDLYGNDLADPSLFEAVGADGSAQTISAVAYNSANKTFTLTFTPVRTVGSTVSIKGITELEAVDIMGYEGGSVDVPLATA